MFPKQFHLRVVPNSSRDELVVEKQEKQEKQDSKNKYKLYLKSVPEKGKANQDLIKFFKKQYKIKVQIKSGHKSRDKILVVVD